MKPSAQPKATQSPLWSRPIAVAVVGLVLSVVSIPVGQSQANQPLSSRSYDEIIKSYTFVGDLEEKSPTRPLDSHEIFWRYPIKIPLITFEIDKVPQTREEREKAFPVSTGEGRPVQHLNRARLMYIEGNYKAARDTLLSSIQRYGTSHELHRRTDFLLGLVFMHLADADADLKVKKREVKNAMAFFTNAFRLKEDLADPFIDPQTPKYLNLMAAIFFNYGRYGGAFGLADHGLNWLRFHGKTDYRIQLRRLFAESFIRNRSYLDAIKEFDISLRDETIVPAEATKIFSRVGDIYFDLNNFELAEEIYSLAIAIDKQYSYVQPAQYVFRGESLFWQKRYSEAQKMFHYALSSAGPSVEELPNDLAAVASIRLADGWLAQADRAKIVESKATLDQMKSKLKTLYRGSAEKLAYQKQLDDFQSQYLALRKPLDKANIAYNRHVRKFPRDHTADQARIRIACLNLPEYGGENVRHARELLHQLKNGIRHDDLNRPLPSFEPKSDKEKAAAVTMEGQVAEGEKPKEANKDGEPKKGEADAAGDGQNSEEEKGKEAKEGEDNQGKNPAKHDNKVDNEIKLKQDSDSEKPLEPLPKEAIHLAWGCEVASFAQHERSEHMINLVREFVKLYPQSSFFRGLETPVKETQKQQLERYFDSNDLHSATIFFEKTRSLLFDQIPESTKKKLFSAYVDLNQSEKAEEFYPSFAKNVTSPMDRVRMAVFSAENAKADHPESLARNRSLADRFSRLKWSMPMTDHAKLFIDRIEGSEGGHEHLRWLLKLTKNWGQSDSHEICNLVFPLVSKIAKNPLDFGFRIADFRSQLTDVLNSHLASLIQFDTFCGYSFLELELTVYRDDPLELFRRLKSREYLPLNEFTGGIFWNISELLRQAGHLTEAEILWQRLTKEGSDAVKEVGYAKLRLDKRKTEVEKLWRR